MYLGEFLSSHFPSSFFGFRDEHGSDVPCFYCTKLKPSHSCFSYAAICVDTEDVVSIETIGVGSDVDLPHSVFLTCWAMFR
jgi:hypothetical protein